MKRTAKPAIMKSQTNLSERLILRLKDGRILFTHFISPLKPNVLAKAFNRGAAINDLG
jgi:hypothetical protein